MSALACPALIANTTANPATRAARDGAALTRATLTLISMKGRQLGRALAHEDGSYALSVPGPGSYVLIAAADGHQPQAAGVVVGREPMAYDVTLTGTARLSGIVRGGRDGSPVAGATVVVTDVRGEVLASATTGADGTFAFHELVAGQLVLAVSATGHRPAAVPVEAGGPDVARCEVELRPSAGIAGVVTAASTGQPLADARVTLTDAEGNLVATTITGADGAYAFADLAEGDYTMVAGGYPPVATAVRLDGSQEDGFVFRLGHPDA